MYDNDLEKVDLMTGLYAEPLPPGFGFSETAFRIFVLMASRRLKSDRFFTDDYRAELYTEIGLNYLKENTMLTVLKRHHPELAPAPPGRRQRLQAVAQRRRRRYTCHVVIALIDSPTDLRRAVPRRAQPSAEGTHPGAAARHQRRAGRRPRRPDRDSNRRNAPGSTTG